MNNKQFFISQLDAYVHFRSDESKQSLLQASRTVNEVTSTLPENSQPGLEAVIGEARFIGWKKGDKTYANAAAQVTEALSMPPALMDLILPNGKRLGEATGAEVAEASRIFFAYADEKYKLEGSSEL